jgi:DMSO/TMAO reductase YedYZ molybdopterin-dependent catalytic subunit
MSILGDMGTPIFWAEGHPGPLAATGWQVEVNGLVERPAKLSYAEIVALPKSIADARLTSVSGFTVRGEWGGVRLSDLFAAVGLLPKATHARFISYRRIYSTCIPLEVALQERTLLAYEFDGEPLEADYGGPLRIFCPYLWGYKSAKSVIAIALQDHSTPGFWEKLGYPDEGQIRARRMLDVNSGRQRRIGDGEVLDFLD